MVRVGAPGIETCSMIIDADDKLVILRMSWNSINLPLQVEDTMSEVIDVILDVLFNISRVAVVVVIVGVLQICTCLLLICLKI